MRLTGGPARAEGSEMECSSLKELTEDENGKRLSEARRDFFMPCAARNAFRRSQGSDSTASDMREVKNTEGG
jgi:hypothetical protein